MSTVGSSPKGAKTVSRYLSDPAEGLSLIADLIAAPDAKPPAALVLEKLNRLIHYDFLNLCSQENLPNEAEVFGQMEQAFAELEDISEFTALANKNIVAVGGSFSSGKSRFLNSIIHDNLLPTDPRPTTVIPTYLSRGDSEAIYALNTFKRRVPIPRDAVKAISHEFYSKYKVGFSHIIEIMMMELPTFPYANIAFLDTPGYTKSDTLVKGDNTDEKRARQHLAQVEHLIWVIDVSKGTLSESDVAFLSQLSLDAARPIFVVLNKADLRLEEDVRDIMELVRERLSEEDIPCAGVAAYNSRVSSANELMGDSVLEYLHQVDSKQKCTRLKQGFEQVFETFVQFNQNERFVGEEWLRLLNTLSLRLRDHLSDEENQRLKTCIDVAKRRAERQKIIVSQFESLADTVDKTVDEVLSYLPIIEEDKTDRGVVGYLSLRNENELAALELDLELTGTVAKIDAFAVYIDCGLSDRAMLYSDDITAKYANSPAELFAVGKECRLQIIEISRAKKRVTVTVAP